LRNRFLRWRTRKSQPPAKADTSWFQQARDWTGFVVSITALITAGLALMNTLRGPRPYLGGLQGENITILRSSEFRLGNPAKAAAALRDENGQMADFPLVIAQPTISNRAQPPNGISVREITSKLSIAVGAKALFSLDYFWFRTTESTSEAYPDGSPDTLIFTSAAQPAPFDLPAGSTWSREILFLPINTYRSKDWQAFSNAIIANCTPNPVNCSGFLELSVRFEENTALKTQCAFDISQQVIWHVQGEKRKFFTSPVCHATMM